MLFSFCNFFNVAVENIVNEISSELITNAGKVETVNLK